MHADEEVMPGARALEVIRELRAGRTITELEDELRAVVTRCRDTGKKGRVVLTIDVEPTKAGDGTYQLHDKVTSKLPEFERHASLFFGTPDGNLQREDPRQQPLDFVRRTEEEPESVRRI